MRILINSPDEALVIDCGVWQPVGAALMFMDAKIVSHVRGEDRISHERQKLGTVTYVPAAGTILYEAQ